MTLILLLSITVVLLAAALVVGGLWARAELARRRSETGKVAARLIETEERRQTHADQVGQLAARLAAIADDREQLDSARAELERLREQLDGSGFRELVGKTVIASAEGASIRGVLTAVYDDAIVLAHPVYLAGARPADVGGEITLSRAVVPMLQRFEDEG